LSGGLGTGKGLNSHQVTCITTTSSGDSGNGDSSGSGSSNGSKVASGWIDGSIRIFDVHADDLPSTSTSSSSSTSNNKNAGIVHSLLFSKPNSNGEEFVSREPLLLNGHNGSQITCLSFDNDDSTGGTGSGTGTGSYGGSTRLASGSSDGTIILWDILNETGLYRLLGHSGPISDVSFLPHLSPSTSASSTRTSTSTSTSTSDQFNGLITSSYDGLVKVWDLNAQCCIQTIANHGGQVLSSTVVSLPHNDGDNDNDNGEEENENKNRVRVRVRLVTGCIDGKVRVYSIQQSKRMTIDNTTNTEDNDDDTPMPMPMPMLENEDKVDVNVKSSSSSNISVSMDDVCFFMGNLPPPPSNSNVIVSHEKVVKVEYFTSTSSSTMYFGYLRNNSKMVDIYTVRSVKDALAKKKRRLRRRREKDKKENSIASSIHSGSGKDKETGMEQPEDKKGKKRGILDEEDDTTSKVIDNNASVSTSTSTSTDVELDQIKSSDEYVYACTVRASHKIKSFEFTNNTNDGKVGAGAGSGGVRIVFALATNALEVHSIKRKKKDDSRSSEEYEFTTKNVSSMDMYGHPTGIRSIALSSDDELACTVSKNIAKVWNVGNRSCLRSLPLTSSKSSKRGSTSSSYGLCSVFLPGNTHVVVGTREGYLLVIDIASGDIVFTEKAHEKEIWSIDIKKPPSFGSGSNQYDIADYNDDEASGSIAIVTGSADKNVKFWEVETQGEDDSSSDEDGGSDDDSDNDDKAGLHIGHPMLVHTRTLESADDVVCVRYSHCNDPAQKMIFVSTLDNQIKVFFDDTLKFFLSLYGHTLPALALDSSDDDAILASGGADKSIKIWGLDFGDTHRTMYGHSDSITDLKFVKKTHNFFTSSKDGSVRYWDGDRFDQILLLNGHISEINCLAISKTGAFVLSGGMDRQVRVWERTKDMVFLEEEKERAMEDMFDKVDNQKGDEAGTERLMRRRKEEDQLEEDDDGDDENENQPQSAAAVKKSQLSVSSGDRIMEALERADQELKDAASFRRSQESKGKYAKERMPSPYLLGMEPPQYMLWVLRSVKSAELEQSLLVLPLHYMERLIFYLILLLRNGQGVELCSRAAIFLVKTHQNQLVGHHKMAIPLRELRRLLKLRLSEARDAIGYNMAAIRIISKVSSDYKSRYHIPDDFAKKDVFGGLGVGSDMAAALQRKN